MKVDRALYDGDVIKVGPLTVTAYLIPGHSASPVTYVYTVRATWPENGRGFEQIRVVGVRAGETAKVDYLTPR